MRPSLRIGVEVLEGKALMSGGMSGLTSTLVATPTTTSAGTTVALTFTETNVSNHPISVTYGPGNDGFSVKMDGKTVWVSNTGIQPQFLVLDKLAPGKSITLTGTWDGHSNSGIQGGPTQEGPALKGRFTISNELDPEVTTSVTLGEPTTHVTPPKPTPRVR